jgi:hypothetical protein
MDRGVVPANQNPRLTRLHQPRSVRGDREGQIGLSWVSMIGVQFHQHFSQITRTPVSEHDQEVPCADDSLTVDVSHCAELTPMREDE